MPSSNQTKILEVFVAASKVLDEYWMHTDGDHENGDVSVENTEKAIENLSGVTIKKEKIEFDGKIIRSKIERKANGDANIFLRSNQSEPWLRYASIKEYSHILLDKEEDYEPDPTVTLEELFQKSGKFIDPDDSPAKRSEQFAEVLALELIYPFEWRETDRRLLDEGGKVSDLETKRGVPAVHIERALNPAYIKSCGEVWKIINNLQKKNSK